MAIASTLDAWKTRALAHFRSSLPGWPLGARKFLGRVSRALSLVGWQLHGALEEVERDIVPSQNSSSGSLEEWAFTTGLPDGEDGFGRKKPTTASGGAATLTGVLGTIYPANLVATAEDGETQIKLVSAVTIPGSGTGSGSIAGAFVAVTAGSAGELATGTVCTWENPPTGADPTFTLTSGLTDGEDEEEDHDLYTRLVSRLQNPPRGGVVADFKLWALVSSIVNVYVYPKRSGTATVDVVVAEGGNGTARQPSEAVRVEAEDAIRASMGADIDELNVLVPYMPAGNAHAVRVRVVPSRTKYNFDWDDTTPRTVLTYAAGPPATLQLNGDIAQSLKDAIDAYKASPTTVQAPRLQVISTGATINPSIRAVDYVDGTDTLTLETVPSGWTAPTVGDAVYAYGPVVATIANAILALCNALGPSKVSGFADTIEPWEDTLTISAITAAAETALDTDGTKLVSKVLTNGATIDGLNGDFQPDDYGADGPELIHLKSIAVTQ